MAGKRRWLRMKSRKVRFCVRDPCTEYPDWMRFRCWNDHDAENLETEIRKSNKPQKAGDL